MRRVAGPATRLLAGLALTLTPAAVLIFRFDNPDALLVLLLVLAAYCVTRALEAGRTRWLVAAGAAVGFAFLTKSGQALLPVPALGLAYLVAAPVSLRRRVAQLVAALAAMVVAAGWWIAAVVQTRAAEAARAELAAGRAGTPGSAARPGWPGCSGASSGWRALVAALKKTTTRWAAAVDGSQSAASLELVSGGQAVMAIGGFTGSDPAPTLAQFKAYVAAGDITYYIAGGGMGGGPGGGTGSASQITSWVEAHFKSVKIGGQTVYVLHK